MKRDWLAVWLGATALGVVLTAVAPTLVTVNYHSAPFVPLQWAGVIFVTVISNLWFGPLGRRFTAIGVAGALLNLVSLMLDGAVTNFIPLGHGWRASSGDALIVVGQFGFVYSYATNALSPHKAPSYLSR